MEEADYCVDYLEQEINMLTEKNDVYVKRLGDAAKVFSADKSLKDYVNEFSKQNKECIDNINKE